MDELGGIVDSDPGELALAGGMAAAALTPPALPATGRPRAPVRAAGGSRSEFGQFYADHYVALVRLATVLSGSADVAPDLVQDCFVGLHRHWITVRDPLPYVRRSVVHACASHHRRAARARGLHPPVLGNSELGADELEDAVAKLPPRQRAAVVLRYYGDLSDADIARALRCRPATVRSLVHRALADLRKVIEP
jgi:DNA-directed RNA polymerase specialized sigma24 family protein